MESLDSSFDQFITSVTDTLNILKRSIKDVHDKTMQYEDMKKSVVQMKEENKKSLARKDDLDSLVKKLESAKQDITDSKKQQDKNAQILDSMREHMKILTQKELEDIDNLEKEVNDLKTHLGSIEGDISNVKARLDRVGTSLQQHVELKRSLRMA